VPVSTGYGQAPVPALLAGTGAGVAIGLGNYAGASVLRPSRTNVVQNGASATGGSGGTGNGGAGGVANATGGSGGAGGGGGGGGSSTNANTNTNSPTNFNCGLVNNCGGTQNLTTIKPPIYMDGNTF
jgi:hypothetical protein